MPCAQRRLSQCQTSAAGRLEPQLFSILCWVTVPGCQRPSSPGGSRLAVSQKCCARLGLPALGGGHTACSALSLHMSEVTLLVTLGHPAFPVLCIHTGNGETRTPLSLDVCKSCRAIIKKKYKFYITDFLPTLVQKKRSLGPLLVLQSGK